MSDEQLEAMTGGSFQDMSDEELEAMSGSIPAPQQEPIASGAGAQEIIGSLGEDEALALTALGEASPNPAEQRAVIHTVLNRQKAGGFGNSLPEILRPDQFNAWEKAEELAAKRDTPQFKRALELVRQVRAGELPDNTGGATHFYAPRAQAEGNAKNPKRYRSAVPSWAQGKEGRQIGATRFFSGV
jgi:conjugal transfer mating pair stabilization protein TraG